MNAIIAIIKTLLIRHYLQITYKQAKVLTNLINKHRLRIIGHSRPSSSPHAIYRPGLQIGRLDTRISLLNHGYSITAIRYRGRTIIAEFESRDIRELAHEISTNLSDRAPRQTDWWAIGNR
jgi:hypothetical protein|nr:MAG TPA: hypothetical protein [Caudoviricetes sp.]